MNNFSIPQIKKYGTFFSDELPEAPEIRRVQLFEIEVFTTDGAEFYLDGKKHIAKKGYVLITKPGQKRVNYLPFSTVYIKVEAKGIIRQKLLSTPDYFLPAHSEDILSELKDVILLNEDAENKILFNAKLLGFLDRIIKESHKSPLQAELHDEIIQKAKRYIKENFWRPIRLKDIAATSHLSETYFHKIFKGRCLVSPNEYLTECRINEAKMLLGFTTDTMGEIAEKCGFCSQPYFNKIFKNQIGCSPSEYRRNIAGKEW